MTLAIGTWVRRPLGSNVKFHLVESVVAEDAITRCGRRMDRENRNGALEVSEVVPEPVERCRQCGRGLA